MTTCSRQGRGIVKNITCKMTLLSDAASCRSRGNGPLVDPFTRANGFISRSWTRIKNRPQPLSDKSRELMSFAPAEDACSVAIPQIPTPLFHPELPTPIPLRRPGFHFKCNLVEQSNCLRRPCFCHSLAPKPTMQFFPNLQRVLQVRAPCRIFVGHEHLPLHKTLIREQTPCLCSLNKFSSGSLHLLHLLL